MGAHYYLLLEAKASTYILAVVLEHALQVTRADNILTLADVL